MRTRTPEEILADSSHPDIIEQNIQNPEEKPFVPPVLFIPECKPMETTENPYDFDDPMFYSTRYTMTPPDAL